MNPKNVIINPKKSLNSMSVSGVCKVSPVDLSLSSIIYAGFQYPSKNAFIISLNVKIYLKNGSTHKSNYFFYILKLYK